MTCRSIIGKETRVDRHDLWILGGKLYDLLRMRGAVISGARMSLASYMTEENPKPSPKVSESFDDLSHPRSKRVPFGTSELIRW